MFSLTIWSRQRIAPCYFLRPSRLEQRNRATRRDRMAALTPTPVPPEAILVGPLSAQLQRTDGDLLCPFHVDSSRLLRANSGHSLTVRRMGQGPKTVNHPHQVGL